VKLSELESKRSPDEGQALEDPVRRFCRADLVRVPAEQHRGVDARTRLLRREALDLAPLYQRVHVAKERLELLCRSVDVDDSDRLGAGVSKCVRDTGGHSRRFSGAHRPPFAVDAHLQRPFDDLVALLGGRVDLHRRPGMCGSTQFVASNNSPSVSSVLRVISHRIPIPAWKSR
jgi:hypothetical protein